MLDKLYLGLLGIAVIIASVLMYFSYTWLLSIGDPNLTADNFQNYSTMTWMFIWVSFLILLIFANYLLWTTKKVWFVWSAFAYFSIFIILHTFWLAQSFVSFKEANNLTDDTFSVSPFLGVGILLAVAIGVFFDQYIVLRLRNKMKDEQQEMQNI